MVFALALITIVADIRWLTFALAYGFLARVLTGPKASPMGQLATRFVAPKILKRSRAVLAEFGTYPAAHKQVRVHDSNADLRYLVLPQRPAGTEGWSEAELAQLVTRDSMIGVAPVRDPATVQRAAK